MSGVARELAMSTRTLQRRLKDEGATRQDVLSDTRKSLALHYLSASDSKGTPHHTLIDNTLSYW